MINRRFPSCMQGFFAAVDVLLLIGVETLTQLYLFPLSFFFLISTTSKTQAMGSTGRGMLYHSYVSYDECMTVRCCLFGLDSVASALFKFSTHPGWLWLSPARPAARCLSARRHCSSRRLTSGEPLSCSGGRGPGPAEAPGH